MPPMGPRPRGIPGGKPPVENPGKVFGRLMKYAFKGTIIRWIIVIACIVTTVNTMTVQGTLFTRTLVDDFITPLIGSETPDYSGLLKAIIRVAIMVLIGVAATFIQQRIMVTITQGFQERLRNDLFEHMESLPIKYFDTHAHGDIMSVYTNDVDTMRQMISQSIPQFFSSAITIVTVVINMILLSGWLTLLSFAMVALMLFVTKYVASKSGKYFVGQQKNIGALNGYVEEMMSGQKVVKVFCHEDECKEKFDELNEALYESAYRANQYGNLVGPINAQIGNVSYVVLAIVGGAFAINGVGGFTLGALASFLTFSRTLNMPISQVSMQINSIIMALAGGDRIFRMMDEQPETDEGYVTLVNARRVDKASAEAASIPAYANWYSDEKGEYTVVETEEHTGLWAWKHYHKTDNTTTFVELKGDVVFDGVDFGYTDEKMVLHDIKLFAKPGQKIAFVGSTGAGKTTITNLINRFYDIQDGKIRYDAINVNKIKKADLRRSLGIVLQDTHLFTGTVMENIRYGKLDATDEEVIKAAKLANAHSFIKRLPEGYNTKLTGDGANLSQGQRQLLAIARAAIADPPVLILDEATSSIDTRTEKIVQDGMDKLMKGRTTFVIAHRLSTVRNSDCIMVLEQGRIIERGTHDELLEMKGKYYQLYTGNSITA
ncbi:MAG: ABC transporter ATP-binding protein [Lachnospiraceae bacterium]|nr:ABC transporter ATP-binding protein [Lachnospiraceae bacterium]